MGVAVTADVAAIANSAGSILSSPLFWAIAAVAVAIVAIIVTVIVAARGRERRRLAYDTTATRLVHKMAEGHIDITYEGERVHDVHLVEVRVANVGNVAIRTAELETPLVVAFANGAGVLSADVIATQPTHLAPLVATEPHGVSIQPLLLNPGDGLTVTALVRDFAGGIELRGRVAGVREFETNVETTQERLLRTVAEATSGSVGVLSFGQLLSLIQALVKERRGRSDLR